MDVVRKRKIFWVICRIAVIVLFAAVVIVTARVHEPWSDEAQSFLIARDNSVGEIVDLAKYEGTTPTWFLVIKLFLSLGGSYETFFLLPLIFTVIGLIIFEFKVKAPWQIKILLPFTYFILFQYTIVARSYCMVFPALMWIASVYNERKKKRLSYLFAMFFLMSVCSFSFLMAGSLWLIDVLSVIKEKKHNKKDIVSLAIIAVELTAVLLIMLPNPECTYKPVSSVGLFDIIYQSTIGSRYFTMAGSTIVTFVIIAIIWVALLKEKDTKRKTVDLLVLFVPVLMEVFLIAPQIWHIGNITLLMFAVFMMNGMINDNKIIKILMIVICLFQIGWSAVTIGYDFNNNYSASKDVAVFIKQNNYEDKNIYGLGFDSTALQPYFEHNIFKNMDTKGAWSWKKDSGRVEDKTLLNDGDVFVIDDFRIERYRRLYDELVKKGYKDHYFEGYMFAKTYIYESKGYHVLVK